VKPHLLIDGVRYDPIRWMRDGSLLTVWLEGEVSAHVPHALSWVEPDALERVAVALRTTMRTSGDGVVRTTTLELRVAVEPTIE
jgi:hypothetical protein